MLILLGSLAAPRGAEMMDVQVGQWLTNVRRPGGLGKDLARAQRRAAAPAAADPDWNPTALGWTVAWQQHHAYQACSSSPRVRGRPRSYPG
ncbi:hypothetical protein [Streptomyces erythrochromogenes]|uniref:hypothetical protein n=1 Tax=Streptomyces erythrochromogenes TaxID=285574 RepID=UPI003869DCFA|nr:hypothetical protein OG489_37805 [Streptomyces erythrochromogenes]